MERLDGTVFYGINSKERQLLELLTNPKYLDESVLWYSEPNCLKRSHFKDTLMHGTYIDSDVRTHHSLICIILFHV